MMTSMTIFGLSDYQTIIAAGLGINAATFITAGIWKPDRQSIYQQFERATATLDVLKSDLTAPTRLTRITKEKLKYAELTIECAKAEIEDLSDSFVSWIRLLSTQDFIGRVSQILSSLFAIFLLFFAVLHPDQQVSVAPERYQAFVHFNSAVGEMDAIICLTLFVPFFLSLVRFCSRFLYALRTERTLRAIVSRTKRCVVTTVRNKEDVAALTIT